MIKVLITIKRMLTPLDLLGVPALISMVLYGGWGIRWWDEIDGIDFGRSMIVMLIHAIPLIFWFPSIMERYEQWQRLYAAYVNGDIK